MVGAILTQNTAWTNVEKSIARLREAQCLEVEAILRLKPRQLAELIRPSGYYNIKQKRLRALCHWYQEQGPLRRLQRRETASLREELLAVHGVGPETADDILLYALRRPVFVVDAYTKRLLTRLGLVPEKVSYEEMRYLFEQALPTDPNLYDEYHARIVLHGKYICQSRSPRCESCQLQPQCTYGQVHALKPLA